jgi:hypothetical protein
MRLTFELSHVFLRHLIARKAFQLLLESDKSVSTGQRRLDIQLELPSRQEANISGVSLSGRHGNARLAVQIQ